MCVSLRIMSCPVVLSRPKEKGDNNPHLQIEYKEFCTPTVVSDMCHVEGLYLHINWDLNSCYLTLKSELNQNTTELNYRMSQKKLVKKFLEHENILAYLENSFRDTFEEKKKSLPFHAVGK